MINYMNLILIVITGISFILYGISLLTSPRMKAEFVRFGLNKFTTIVGVLELLGGIGLLVGIHFPIVLLISSGGLAILMLLGFGVRLKMRDGFWLSIPSVLFLIINFYLFLNAALQNET